MGIWIVKQEQEIMSQFWWGIFWDLLFFIWQICALWKSHNTLFSGSILESTISPMWMRNFGSSLNLLCRRMCIGHKMRLRSLGSGSVIISRGVWEILQKHVEVLMFLRVSVTLLCWVNSSDSYWGKEHSGLLYMTYILPCIMHICSPSHINSAISKVQTSMLYYIYMSVPCFLTCTRRSHIWCRSSWLYFLQQGAPV
jgi:hypothetical protein